MATDIKRLLEEIRSLPPDQQRRLSDAIAEELSSGSTAQPSTSEMSDEDYQRRLVEAGLLKQVRPRLRDQVAFERFKPVPILGKPLSETIVEERR